MYVFYVENGELGVWPPFDGDLEGLSPEELRQTVMAKWVCLFEYHRDNPHAMQPRGAGGSHLCAYCLAHLCYDCPIGVATGEAGCAGTPFIAYTEACTPEECLAATCAELVFLEEV